MLTLDKAKPNSQIKIIDIQGNKALRRRLMEFGVLPQTEILVNKVAPLGDPIELTVKNCQITIRKEDASNVIIEEK